MVDGNIVHGTVTGYRKCEESDVVILQTSDKKSVTVSVPRGWDKDTQLEFDLGV